MVKVYVKYLAATGELDIGAYRAGAPNPDLVMQRSGEMTIEYAPFDHLERGAELAIVGLTPGRTQAANALEEVARCMRQGVRTPEALAAAKRFASFSGPMRANLLAMLDELGVPLLFGRKKAAEFFSERGSKVHFTSALRYPVYVSGKNYSGAPNLLRHPMLKEMVEIYLLEEVRLLPDAIWVPLGTHAEAALLHLARMGELPRNKVLAGLPHPSGANAERIAYFLGRKPREALSNRTNASHLDGAKLSLARQVSELRRD
ncbi:MAG: hypothetical protein KGR48_00845, partial [Alphaproteobacteria bacterium]|nr:hypothetical protein [Alphaproteobacteria bacterium]